jgi:hypothetical protein
VAPGPRKLIPSIFDLRRTEATMPNAAACDRAALISSYRRGLLARLWVAGIEPRQEVSTARLVELVIRMDRDAQRETRRLMAAPSGR